MFPSSLRRRARIATFVQLDCLVFPGLIAGMGALQSSSNSEADFADLMARAERELGAFVRSVTDLFGIEEARLAADDWIQELESVEVPQGPSSSDWRSITISAASLLAKRVATRSRYLKVSPGPSSNCSGPETLA